MTEDQLYGKFFATPAAKKLWDEIVELDKAGKDYEPARAKLDGLWEKYKAEHANEIELTPEEEFAAKWDEMSAEEQEAYAHGGGAKDVPMEWYAKLYDYADANMTLRMFSRGRVKRQQGNLVRSAPQAAHDWWAEIDEMHNVGEARNLKFTIKSRLRKAKRKDRKKRK